MPVAALAGIVLFAGASLQQFGIVYTTAGKAGFITGLYVVLVPIMGLALGARTRLSTWIGALIAAGGMYLLSVQPPFSIGLGDGLVLVSALFWALHVLLIGRIAARHDWALLAAGQFLHLRPAQHGNRPLHRRHSTPAHGRRSGAHSVRGVLSVGIAYTLQVVAQRKAPPAHAAVILSLETVFAALGGWLLLDEHLPSRSLTGCGLMLIGMLISQWQTGDRDPQQERLSAAYSTLPPEGPPIAQTPRKRLRRRGGIASIASSLKLSRCHCAQTEL